MTFLLLLAAWVAGGAFGNTQEATPPPDTSAYVWDAACKDCHSDIHTAWSRTKHATAINSLSPAQRQQECAGCHLTGSSSIVADASGKPVNAGVQCESCHGAAREHAEAAVSGSPTRLPRKPDQKLCETCHNSKSPHFRGFFYAAMAPLVHKVK
jgi:hypothetical protein